MSDEGYQEGWGAKRVGSKGVGLGAPRIKKSGVAGGQPGAPDTGRNR